MSGNMLKMIALIAMTIDHLGMIMFPEYEWMRIVGRVAFPIFAFMIAEGCRYTKNRAKYLSQIGFLGIGMQMVLYFATGSLYQSVFISFSLAIILIYTVDRAKSEQKIEYWLYVGAAVLLVTFLCFGLTDILEKTDYDIDYNIVGILIPIMCYFTENRRRKIWVFALGLIALSVYYGGIQWYCLLAIPLVGMYNYRKGKANIKNFFYYYYPAHMCLIYVIDMIIGTT